MQFTNTPYVNIQYMHTLYMTSNYLQETNTRMSVQYKAVNNKNLLNMFTPDLLFTLSYTKWILPCI